MINTINSKWKPVVYATAIILFITVLTRLFNLDILITGLFYEQGVGFPAKQDLFVRFFYESIPVAVTVSVLFFIGFAIAAFKWTKLRKYNRLVLALFIAMVIGPGLIVNSVFKDNFGRPRPSQTVEFGGEHQSRAVLESNWGNYGKSFPSGHASIPVSFILLAFAAYRRNKLKLAFAVTAVVVVWYLAVSYARIAAGGHHFTDVCWAAYFSFVCAWFCFWFIEKPKRA